MLRVSLWTSLLGLTEPLFVPRYWNPPSLFGLAQSTGFDIESLIFAFGVGGISVLYDLIFPRIRCKMADRERMSPRHRFHLLAIWSGPIVFIGFFIWGRLNPIYDVIIALTIGSIATALCRPDLLRKMLFTGPAFLFMYFFYFSTLVWAYPAYVRTVWNLKELTGIFIGGIPVEELIFALVLGFYWASVYEHLMMVKLRVLPRKTMP